MKKMNLVIAIILTAIIGAGVGFIAGSICEHALYQKIYNHVAEMAEEDMNNAIEEFLNEYEEN